MSTLRKRPTTRVKTMNALLLILALTVQTHTPTATVTGDVVTVSADFAWIEPAAGTSIVVPIAIKDGVQLIDPTMLASTDGVKPIAWQLSPGSYKVTAFGYPDNRLFPQRTKVVLDVTVLSPTRQQQIAEAVKAYSIASADSAEALAELKVLKPTKAELAAALTQ